MIKNFLNLFLIISSLSLMVSCGSDKYIIEPDAKHNEEELSNEANQNVPLRLTWLVNESTQMAGYTSELNSGYLSTRARIFNYVIDRFGRDHSTIQLVRRRKEADTISHDAFENLIRFPARIQHYEVTSENQLVELAISKVKKPEDVVFLLSNGIMSYNADSILANLNRTGDDNILLNNIINSENLPSSHFRESVSRNKTLAMALYAFRSSFTGTYFNAEFIKNGKTLQKSLYKMDDQSRPFYLWAFGSSAALSQLESELAATLNPAYACSWGIGYELQQQPDFLNTGKSGEGYILDGKLVEVDLNSKVGVSLAIDLAHLPQYLQDSLYLNGNSWKYDADHLEVAHSRFRPFDITSLDNVDYEIILNRSFSHLFDLSIGPFRSDAVDSTAFGLTLTAQQDRQWLRNISVSDDRDVNNTLGKTFGIAVLANELDRLFADRNEILKLRFKVKINSN